MTRYRAMAATIMTPREFLEELTYPAEFGSTGSGSWVIVTNEAAQGLQSGSGVVGFQ